MKTRYSLSWVFIIIIVGVIMDLGIWFLTSEVKADENTAQSSGTVNNVAPVVSGVNLNGGNPIILSENATTTVSCTATITDNNGGDDITSCSAVIYRSGVGSSCTADDSNCYIVDSSHCTLGAASGNDKSATATADIYFYADPTDNGTYSAETWQCQITGTDAGSLTGSATDATPPELDTLTALDVDNSITYDNLDPGTSMSTTSIPVTVTNTGNVPINVQLKGTDMTYSSSAIPVGDQRYATDTVSFANGTQLTDTYTTLNLNLPKPTTSPSDSTGTIYWGWQVPAGIPAGTYQGTDYFSAVGE